MTGLPALGPGTEVYKLEVYKQRRAVSTDSTRDAQPSNEINQMQKIIWHICVAGWLYEGSCTALRKPGGPRLPMQEKSAEYTQFTLGSISRRDSMLNSCPDAT